MILMEASSMRQIDKIRQQCLKALDDSYAGRMIELVDEMRLEDAEAIMNEMVYSGKEEDDVDLFMDDLTEWNQEEVDGIYFEDLNETVDDD